MRSLGEAFNGCSLSDMKGTVRTWDPETGTGLVRADNGEYFPVEAETIRGKSFRILREGCRVGFRVRRGSDGARAEGFVRLITAREASTDKILRALLSTNLAVERLRELRAKLRQRTLAVTDVVDVTPAVFLSRHEAKLARRVLRTISEVDRLLIERDRLRARLRRQARHGSANRYARKRVRDRVLTYEARVLDSLLSLNIASHVIDHEDADPTRWGILQRLRYLVADINRAERVIELWTSGSGTTRDERQNLLYVSFGDLAATPRALDLHLRAAKKFGTLKQQQLWVARHEIKSAEERANARAEELKRLVADIEEQRRVAEEVGAEEFIALGLFGNRLKVVSLLPDGTYRFLDGANNLHSILYLVSAETRALERAVEELESLVNDHAVEEADLQNFFERYPDFILEAEHKAAHPHVVLTRSDSPELIPDFLLEPLDQTGLCDLLELKLPSADAFALSSRPRFSAAVFAAAAQLRSYSLFFDEERNRMSVEEKYGLRAYKPRMFVLIGRRGKVSPIDLRNMQLDAPNLYLKTYDDVINRMKARVKSMTHRSER